MDTPTWAVITEYPLHGESKDLLAEGLSRSGIQLNEAIQIPLRKAWRKEKFNVTECRDLRASIEETCRQEGITHILGLGAEVLKVLTGKSGITKHRGLADDWKGDGSAAFITLHPQAVLGNVRYRSDWLNDLATFGASLCGTEEDVEIVIVRDAELLPALLADLEAHKGFGALDVETTIGDPFKGECQMVSISVSFDGHRAWVIDAQDEDLFNEAMFVLARGEWIMHNGSFDLMILKYFYPHLTWKLKHDTMAMAYLLHPEERKGLEILSGVWLGLPPYKGVDYKNILEEPFEKVAEMNGRDTARTFRLFRPLADELNQKPHLSRTYQWLLMPAITALVDITLRGVPVDRQRLQDLEDELTAELAEKLVVLQEKAGEPDDRYGKEEWSGKKGFNPASTQQVGHVLFDKMGYPVIKETDTGGRSTDAEVLDKLTESDPDNEFLWALKDYRTANKSLTAFVNSWKEYMDEDDRLHPRYKPTQVVTGRLSSEKPNIQQVPRSERFRRVFGGVPGFVWVKADFSQMELRIAAWLAQEPTMMQAYQEGADLHAITAQKVLGIEDVMETWKPGRSARDLGKVLNFSLLYGAYPTKLMEIARSQYGMTLSKQEASEYRAIFFDSYPRLARWHSEVKAEVRATGQIASPLGRVRTFPEVNDPDEWVVKRAEREAVNHPVQSFGSDLVVGALTRLPPEIRGYAIAEVHDEIDFLIPEGEVEAATPIIKATMEDLSWLKKWGIEFTVPVLVDVDTKEYWA